MCASPDLLTLRCRRQQASKQRAKDILHKGAFWRIFLRPKIQNLEFWKRQFTNHGRLDPYFSKKMSNFQKAKKVSRLGGPLSKIDIKQTCSVLSYISVISSIFINKFDQKCHYFTLMDQSFPTITVASLVYFKRKQLWAKDTIFESWRLASLFISH